MISRLRYRMKGLTLTPSALSNVEQHSWLGYYIVPAPGGSNLRDPGSGGVEPSTQDTVELRLSRTLDDALHENVEVTNYSQRPVTLQLAIDLDADFADLIETREGNRRQ